MRPGGRIGRRFAGRATQLCDEYLAFPTGQCCGILAMDYAKLTPVLVEAIKDQQRQIDELKALVSQLVNGSGETSGSTFGQE
jgi:hypothetical protein